MRQASHRFFLSLPHLGEDKHEPTRYIRDISKYIHIYPGAFVNDSFIAYQSGSTIGPYTLIESVGEGGMGSVWRARRSDGLMDREVAIKLIALGMRTVAIRERFARERQILASLNHPNIARLYDAGLSGGGQPYLVLELVEGERIDVFADRVSLPVAARLKLFLQVLAAVGHAHQHLIVHRDLKPSNILVSPQGEVKLLDFGVSKLLDDSEQAASASAFTREAGRLLTPEYAAPEQLKNHPITTATDVYALGVLLYQLLTGCLPYADVGDTPISLARAIVEADPPRASQVATRSATLAPGVRANATDPGPYVTVASMSDDMRDNIPAAQFRAHNAEAAPQVLDTISPDARADKRATTTRKLASTLTGDLDNILAKALKKDPYERYATVAEFADDIRAHLELRPVKAQPDTLRYRTEKFVRRNRGAVATAGFTMFAMLAGIAATAWQANEARKQSQLAQAEAQKANAIRDYMVNMFRAVGRDAKEFPKRGDTTARELIDLASQRLNGELADQPAVRAFMRETLSGLYSDLDKNPQALSEAKRWLEEAEKSFSPTHPQVIGALLQQGLMLGKMNQPQEAHAALDRAKAALAPLPRAEQWVRLHITRGLLHSAQYESKLANEAFEQARQSAAAFPQFNAELDYAQGQVAFQDGRYRFGQEKLSAAIEGYRKIDGDHSVRVAEARWRLGILQLYRNDWLEAEKEFTASWNAFKAQTQAGHRDAIVVQRDLAFSQARTGQKEKALANADEVLANAKARTVADKNVAFLAGAYQSWGRIHYFLGDLLAAHKAFEESRAAMTSTQSNSFFDAISLYDLALTTAQLGDTDKASAMAEKVVAAYENKYKPEHLPVLTVKVTLADALKEGNPSLARRYLQGALSADWSETAYPATLVRARLVATELALRARDFAAANAELDEARNLLQKHAANPEAKFRAAQADVLAVRLANESKSSLAQACARVDGAIETISQFNVANSPHVIAAKSAQQTCAAAKLA
jgi:eukaryotic-like serine/threonine-protein kinase